LKYALEETLNDDGTLDRSALPDCDLFAIQSITNAAGYSDPDYFAGTILADPRSFFNAHRIPLIDEEKGSRVGEVFATHTNSAIYGGFARRKQVAAERRVGIASAATDVSSSDLLTRS
jgi:hypothetical protein